MSIRLLHSTSLSALALALAACGSTANDASPDASLTAPDAPAITGVGNSCATGCIGADVCANSSTTCEHGYCLFDGRGDQFDSYCTMDCSTTGCPAGYHCEDVPFDLDRACVADPAVCGDGVLERGEACDDGNTASDDGCRGDCESTDTPLGDQRRVRTTVTIAGSYVPKGGVATSFSTTSTVDAELNASNDDCNTSFDIAAGSSSSGQWRRFLTHGCADSFEVDPMFTIPYAAGAVPAGYAHLCAYVELPAPDNARLSYCATSNNEQLVVDTATPGTNGMSFAGHFSGTLAYLPNEAIGGCDGLYAPSACPGTIPATLTISGTFEIVNAP